MQKTIIVGQVQPSILSMVERIVKNLRAKFDQKVEESRFCQVIGVTPQFFSLQGLAAVVVTFLVIVVTCGLAEWLCQKGGAI